MSSRRPIGWRLIELLESAEATGHGPITATEAAHELGSPSNSVSSALHRLVQRGRVIRVIGHGPRGGYGYIIRRDVPSVQATGQMIQGGDQ